MVASVIAAFFYLRVVVTMYASEAEVPEGEEAARAGVRVGLGASAMRRPRLNRRSTAKGASGPLPDGPASRIAAEGRNGPGGVVKGAETVRSRGTGPKGSRQEGLPAG